MWLRGRGAAQHRGSPHSTSLVCPKGPEEGKAPRGVLGKAGQQEQGSNSGCSGEEGGQGLPQEQAVKERSAQGLL